MSKPKDVDSYIANSGREARPKLKEIRKIIKSTIPKAEERIWYGVPFYKYHGELAGFAAYKNHVSFGFGAAVLQSKDRKMLEKKGYITGKGTMQIKFDQKVPTTAIKQILKAKAKMNETKRAMKNSSSRREKTASELISKRIKELGDWRGRTLTRVRQLIKEADPEIVEEWKWRTPVWSHNGLVCTGETYKNIVKMTFSKGASLEDPFGLFNSSLDGNVRRAIDIHEEDSINEAALKNLIRAAVALNRS